MDNLVYENNIHTKVENVEMRKTQDLVYRYVVNLKFIKDGKEVAGKCNGVIEMSKDESGDYKVDFINKMDSKTIHEMMIQINE